MGWAISAPVSKRAACHGAAAAMLSLLVGAAASLPASADTAPASTGGPPTMRRLTPDQYRQTIEDIFGAGIKLGGRFEPDVRANGLLAVGSGQVSVTASGFEQYDGMARAIASQVLDSAHRDVLMPCKPVSATEPDDACASQFLAPVGRMLFRRPLTQSELQAQVAASNASAKSLKSFYAGLETGLADLLVSPQFLFRQEVAEADPANAGQFRLNAFSKASQLSFFLWNTAPDDVLLTAAEKGDLNTEKGLARQVDRLLTSRRLETGVRALFGDMLGFDDFARLSKDAVIYPKFTPKAMQDAQEQTLRTIVDHLLVRRADYRDLFTTRHTFLTPTLGIIYGVPVVQNRPIGEPEMWVPYDYDEGDPRTGLLTQASFVSLHSHPGRSSPTLRGKALREVLLCQKVPDPPGNVKFTVVQDTNNPQYKTARERVTAHRTDPTCAGCHKLIDPMGLALENFDSAGGFRLQENGAKIDASGELDGTKFEDAAGLGKAMHDHPATPACLVNRTYSYALGRPIAKGETEFVKYIEKNFAANGYRLPDLLRQIVTSDAFYRVTPQQVGALETSAPRSATGGSSLQGGTR